LWDAVQARLRATTSLSASLLAEAEQGYAVPPLVRLCEALVAGEEREAAAHAQMVAAIGHSSGRDLLAGLAGGLAGALESGLEIDLQRGATDPVRSVR
jgi:hypothetical protein